MHTLKVQTTVQYLYLFIHIWSPYATGVIFFIYFFLIISRTYFVNCMYTSVHFAGAMPEFPHCGTNKGISYLIRIQKVIPFDILCSLPVLYNATQ